MTRLSFGAAVLSVLALGACKVGDARVPGGGGDDPDAMVAEEATWVPITDGAQGAVQFDVFQLDSADRIMAIVAGQIQRWELTAWVPVAAPPEGQTIVNFRVKNDQIFALLDTGLGKQICEYVNLTWEPRTVVADTYAGGFSVHAQGAIIYAVLEGPQGRQIAQCDLTICTPMTPIATISAVDFDCNGCGGGGGGGGGGGDPVFWSQLGTQVCSSTQNAAWVPQTSEALGLGPNIDAETTIIVEIDDKIAAYNTSTMVFDDLTDAFTNMTHFQKNLAGNWMALADGVVCEYK